MVQDEFSSRGALMYRSIFIINIPSTNTNIVAWDFIYIYTVFQSRTSQNMDLGLNAV